MKRFAASILTVGLIVTGLLFAPQAAFAVTSVYGTVTRAADAAPIWNADVLFLQDGVVITSTYTDSNGDFATTSVPPGDYVVSYSMSGYGTENVAATVVDGVPLALNQALDAESTITGVIRDEDGNPIDFAFVSVATAAGGWVYELGDVTGADGEYAIHQLTAGDAKILVGVDGNYQTTWYASGYNNATATVIVVPGPGGTVVADVTVPTGAIIGGTVVDSIGSPVTFVEVTATGPGLDFEHTGWARSDGLYAIKGLHPQAYSLVAEDNSFGLFAPSAVQPATAVLGTPAIANFVVTPELVDISEFEYQVELVSGPTTVEAGMTYSWTVKHYGNQNVYAILYSSPTYLGAAARNPDGSATLKLTIPQETTPGAHKLTFSGVNDAGEGSSLEREYLDITVTAPALPAAGTDAAPMGALAVLLCGLGLLALVSLRRPARR